MPITLSRADYDELWHEQALVSEPSVLAGFAEMRRTVSEQLGQGYIQSMRWSGIELTLYHYQFHDDVHVLYEAQDEDSTLGEIGFHLSGNRHGYRTGENFIQWGACDKPDPWVAVTCANAPVCKIDIHLEASHGLSQFVADTLADLPAEIRQGLEGDNGCWLHEVNTLTPAMRLPLTQIFQCPLQGRMKQLYLEGKCLELIALKLDQLQNSVLGSTHPITLHSDDVDRIHAAQKILIENPSDPPSLMELARQVSLNDYKLKVGFKQVFGTTVFGYLHCHRMELARQMLSDRRLNVKEVAQAVGYANQSRFAAAFRKQFGINPKSYLLSKKSG
jgi:AraC-like DNA-binding protein